MAHDLNTVGICAGVAGVGGVGSGSRRRQRGGREGSR